MTQISNGACTVLLFIAITVFVLVPLVFWHGVFFPFTFVKTMLFYTLVEAACLVWVLTSCFVYWKNSQRNMEKKSGSVTAWVGLSLQGMQISILHIVCVGFLVWLGISSFAGVDATKSIWSDGERMFGLVTWLHLIVFFLILSSVLTAARAQDIAAKSIIGTAAVVSLHAIWQGFTTADLATATIGNAAYLSSYLVPIFFLTLMFLLSEERFRVLSWVYAAVLVMILAAVAFTQARAGVVGLGAGIGTVFVLFLFLGNREGRTLSVSHTRLKQIATLLIIAGVGGGALLLFAPEMIQPFVPDRLSGLLDFDIQERTASARILVWSVAWDGWKERFFTGWGLENFNILFNTHYDPALYIVEPWFDRAHNVLFDVGSVAGIVGIFFYVSMFGAAAFMAVRQWRRGQMPFWTMNMAIALLVSHLMQNMFTFDTLSSFLIIIYLFGYIVGREHYPAAHVPSLFPARQWGSGAFMTVAAAGLLGICVAFYIAVLQPMLANAAARNGWELLRMGGGDEAATRQFEKSLSYDTAYSIDARRFMAEYVFEFLKQEGDRPASSLQYLIEYAIKKMDENIQAEPRNVKWMMYRGELFMLMAQKFDSAFVKNAEEDFLRAKKMSPGRPQVYLELAETRKRQGDVETAWRHLDLLIQTVPEFAFAHANAAVLAVEMGDREREKRELVWLGAHDELGYEPLRDAFYKQERYQDAVMIQEEIMEGINTLGISFARRAVYYAHLAALYQKAGELERARYAALEVLRLDPGRRSEVEVFLQMLQ